MTLDVPSLRSDTPGVANVLHFNTMIPPASPARPRRRFTFARYISAGASPPAHL